jgi:nucleoside-diphosphate-sugar epimerase
MRKHVLVTGGSGFVGRALCTSLKANGFIVTAMVRHIDACMPEGIEYWVTPALPDLASDALQQLANIDIVIHAAGRAHMLKDRSTDQLAAFRRVNTEGTLNMARAAFSAGVRRFIFVSSIGVNGAQSGDRAFQATDLPQPDTPYSQSKWEAELALSQLQKETGMTVMLLRPPMIYGQEAPGNFALLSKLVAKGWPLPLGSLHAPRSFVALDNVVDLLTHMANHSNPPSGVYLVSDAHVTTTTQFVREMSKAMGLNLFLIPLPADLLFMLASLVGRGEQIRKMSVPLAVDIASTKSRLGWTPPFSMEVAMKRAFSETNFS